MGLFSGIGKLIKKVAAPVIGAVTGSSWIGPLIGAGAQLLGGAKEASDSRAAVAAQNAYNDPAEIRRRYEAAGFNPLLAFGGTSIGQQTSVAGGGMGTGLANAGALIADELSRNSAQVKRNNELEKENDELKKRVADSILRPKVAGVYGTVTPDKTEMANKISSQNREMQGPRPMVEVRNVLNGRWMKIDPQLADQIGVKAGDWWTAEHTEAVAGDLVGEGFTTGSVASGAWNKDGIFGSVIQDMGDKGAADRTPKAPNAGALRQKKLQEDAARRYRMLKMREGQ